MEITAVMIVLYIISKFLTGYIVRMLCSADKAACRAVNYKGRAIPAIGGIVFAPLMLIAVLLLLFLFPFRLHEYMGLLLAVYCMGFAGVVDDLAGSKDIKGLKRHISSTLTGNMTTGFLKAMTGLLIAFLISFKEMASIWELSVNIIVIALSANTMNLFDLRPGRAVKVYFIAAILLFSAADIAAASPLLAMTVVVFAYFSYDLKEVCMLGDTGANILGISLGYYATLLLDFKTRVFWALLMILINLAAERISISDIIGRSRLLSYIDTLGREGDGSR